MRSITRARALMESTILSSARLPPGGSHGTLAAVLGPMIQLRQTIPLILVLAVVFMLVVLGRQQRLPDVILIVLDTTRADALSCYGQARATTPHIDALAEDGTVFLRATSPSPWTCPSVASIFTGLLPSQHGLHLENIGLRSHHLTIAEVLAQAGYQTA